MDQYHFHKEYNDRKKKSSFFESATLAYNNLSRQKNLPTSSLNRIADMTRVLPPVKREKKYNSVDFSAESICMP